MSNEQEFIVVTPAMLRRVAELEKWRHGAIYYLDDLVPDHESNEEYSQRFKEQLDKFRALIEEANRGKYEHNR